MPIDTTYECWAWVEETLEGEGLIAAAVPKLEHLGLIPMISRRKSIVDGWESIVRDREAASGFPARQIHLVEDSPDALGKANWIYDDELGCHIPCCRVCGNGPLNTRDFAEGKCNEYAS